LSFKKDVDQKVAAEIANDFLRKTKGLCKRCELAGSLRRKEPVVHDIDFAVVPKGDDFGVWGEEVKKRVTSIGGRVISFGKVICNFLYRDVQVNFFLCLNEEAWGVTLMWATGPKGHTIGMTIKARDKGLIINSTGIWTREEPPRLVGAETEREVGRMLGWKYKPPEARGKSSKQDSVFY
jgi:DNA polymerase/3'-5' exonuclease PolX